MLDSRLLDAIQTMKLVRRAAYEGTAAGDIASSLVAHDAAGLPLIKALNATNTQAVEAEPMQHEHRRPRRKREVLSGISVGQRLERRSSA